MDEDGNWIALLSGGKDSSWALYRAQERGLSVSKLLTAQPREDSYLFHVPAIEVTSLLADSIGIPFHSFPLDPPETDDATAEGDAELATLRDELVSMTDAGDETTGLVTGAVASQYQHDRLQQLCADLDLEQFAPLWQCEPDQAIRRMLDAGFDIRIVAVAAAGLDASWLGRRLDEDALAELLELHERYGIHPMGEGGEFETLVVDGPHMSQVLKFDADVQWDGTRGQLSLADAWLAE